LSDAAARPAPRRVAITGAGSGLGEAMARRFSAAGDRVAVVDVDSGRARAVAGELEATGAEAFAFSMDVRDDAGWSGLREALDARWGGLDVLVNNAGVAAGGRLEDTPMADWEWVIDIDLMGVVRGCHAFLPGMRARGAGHVVNIASFAGLSSVPEVAAYTVAKAAVVTLSEQLRVDLDGSGVGVSVVCPAYVRTRLLDTFRAADERQRSLAQRWMEQSEVSAEDVAQAVFDAVRERRFLVLTHPKTRWFWRYRRWAPERYHRTMARLGRRLRGG